MGWKPDAMNIALSRTQWMASAAVAVFLAALGGTAAVQAQSRDRDAPAPPAIEWDKRRLERLERNVRRLEAQLARANRDPNAVPTIIEPDAETVALQARVNEMHDRLLDMEATLRRLNGELESAGMDLGRARQETVEARNEIGPLRTRIAELETRIATLEAGAVQTGAEAGDPQGEFDAAMRLVNEGSLNEGGAAFEAFIKKYPDAEQTPEAHYRLAETLYSRDESELAVASYSRALKGWPQTRWAAEATLKLATSLANIGRNQQACAAAREFDTRYASSSSANARNRSAAIKSRAKCG